MLETWFVFVRKKKEETMKRFLLVFCICCCLTRISLGKALLVCDGENCETILAEDRIIKFNVNETESGGYWVSWNQKTYHYCDKCIEKLLDVLNAYDIEYSSYTRKLIFTIGFPEIKE